MIAALFVETGGCYFNLPFIDPWDIQRDARTYPGPYRVIAHPPCKRWGRFWHGGVHKPHQYKLGDDDGCFLAALQAVERWGGVIEHPADSHAWKYFGLTRPKRFSGWFKHSKNSWTCYVEQGNYGHFSRKATWLFFVGKSRPMELDWSRSPQRLHPVALERYGYEKARRIGMIAMIGGKNKENIRNATPIPFRDLLINLVTNYS